MLTHHADLLSAEEEVALSRRVHDGDRDAERLFVEKNQRLVNRIAGDYLGLGLPREDLVAEGNIGLLTAVRKYDPEGHRMVRFATYATLWIKQAICRAIANQGGTIRIPIHTSRLMIRFKATQRRMIEERGRAPAGDVARVLGFTRKQVRMVNAGLRARRFTGPHDDIWVDEGREPIEHATLAKLHRVLATLEDLERKVIDLCYGLDGDKPKRMATIARDLNCSREWVRIVRNRALRKLEQAITR